MSETTQNIRVRFPPSPTGFLHVGNVRTAIFNWLLARRHGGAFILRIEDTDRARLVPGSVEVMLDTLRWMGMDWDEGPDVGGPYRPYYQSERLAAYVRYAKQLLESGWAYRCYCTPERLAELRTQQQREKRPTGYDRRCRKLSPEERAELEVSGVPSVVRFAVPLDGTTTATDLLRGSSIYQNSTLDDFVIMKSDGYPPYHFAVVIDDHLMKITHVIRGEEYISSFARDSLLHEAFGWAPPLYAHGARVLGPDRAKLSKRHGSVSALELRERGIVPEALFNYLSLLGASYSADHEFYSREELVSLFDIARMSPSPAIFDQTKLEWMNAQYINHRLSLEDVARRCRPYLEEAGLVQPEDGGEYIEQVVSLVKDRIKLLPEVVELTEFFFREPTLDAAQLLSRNLTLDAAHAALRTAHGRLANLAEWAEPDLEREMREAGAELGLRPGVLFMALRVAVTGSTISPGLFETMRVLGRERTLARIERAVEFSAPTPAGSTPA